MVATKLNVNNKKETLAEMAQRYKILSHPATVNNIMRSFTYYMDNMLKERMESLPNHPKDTGLLKKSWQIPEMYLKTHSGKMWQVYLNNTATVGQQAQLKNQSMGTVHRKKKLTGRHNLKRYMPFVDKRTKFYTRQLRVIRNKVDSSFKYFMGNYVLHQASVKGLLTPEESMRYTEEFT